jgi:uncharacterized protein YbaP (TraB family)
VRSASLLPGGDLETLLGRARFERVADAGWRYGLPASGLRRLKPWAVMLLLSAHPSELARRNGRETSPRLDLVLQRRGTAQGMVIFGLESASEQIALFDELSVADQVAFLDAAIAENASIGRWWRTMKEAYLARNVGAISELLSESRTADDQELLQLFQERLIDQRNERMVERMEQRLAEGHAFIAVGALHLPGKRGILNLLEQRGYAVTRVY